MSDLHDDAPKDFNVIFVHSDVDEAGLTAAEFRVYGHIARRASKGDAWPGIASMAKACRLNEDTVRKAIQELIARGMITRRERPGFTPIYKVTKRSAWRHPSQTRGGVGKDHPSPETGGEGYETRGGVPSQTRGGEDTPLKGIQEGNPKQRESKPIKTSENTRKSTAPPRNFALPPTLALIGPAWDRWQQHLREIGKPLTKEQSETQIRFLSEWEPGIARKSIENSINSRWSGLFYPYKEADKIRSAEPPRCAL